MQKTDAGKQGSSYSLKQFFHLVIPSNVNARATKMGSDKNDPLALSI